MEGIKLTGRIFFDPDNKTKKHNKQSSWKRTAMIIINDDLPEYYAWFVKARYGLELNTPLRGNHVTIINDRINTPELTKNFEAIKEKYHGTLVTFYYDVNVRTNAAHWWLKVNCPEGQSIRNEAGLGDPFYGFHLSIGLVPEDSGRREHSEYILRCIKAYG